MFGSFLPSLWSLRNRSLLGSRSRHCYAIKAMGHESQIELWSPNLTTFCFVGFGTDRLRRQEAMKTAGKENPNRCAITRQPTELLGRKLELSLLNQVGWKARKHPATAKYFFLTFPFIELCRSFLRISTLQQRTR